jgi:lactoylglutathione lyase
MPTTPNLRLAVPFFMVRDMDASLKFYVHQLGFTVTNQWTPRGVIEWCWLQREEVSLMLQQPAKKDHWIYNLPENGKGISICFQCADALSLYQEFTAKGVKIKEPFVGNGFWVVNFQDPDGYTLDFESPTKIPEETRYSDLLH